MLRFGVAWDVGFRKRKLSSRGSLRSVQGRVGSLISLIAGLQLDDLLQRRFATRHVSIAVTSPAEDEIVGPAGLEFDRLLGPNLGLGQLASAAEANVSEFAVASRILRGKFHRLAKSALRSLEPVVTRIGDSQVEVVVKRGVG